jgi:hypothetical protein
VLLLEGGGASGDYSKTQLVRRGKDGKAVFQTIDVRQIEKQKKPDVKLEPEDVIFVPKKKAPHGIMDALQKFMTPIWLMRSIAPVPL